MKDDKMTIEGFKKISAFEYCLCLCFILMLTGASIFPNYEVDTYSTFADLRYAAKDMMIRNGRPVSALIYWVSSNLNLSSTSMIWIYTLSGLCFLYFAILLYENSLRQYIENDIIRCLISTLTICNIYFVNYLMFFEKISFMLSIFFSVVAYIGMKTIIEDSGEGKRKVYLFFIVEISLVLSIFSYQPSSFLFIVLLLPVILSTQNRGCKGMYLIKWLSVTGLVYFLAGLADIIIIRVNGNIRVPGESMIKDRIISSFAVLHGEFNILPKWLWLSIILTTIFICIYKSSHKLETFWHIIVISSLTGLCSIFSYFLGLVYFPRVVYVFACLPMLLLIDGFISKSFGNVQENSHMMVYLVCILAINTVGFNKVFKDKYNVNYLDNYRCEVIGQAISEYQAKTGNTIKCIAYYYDKIITKTSYYNDFLMTSAFNADWSNVNAINYYLGTKFVKIEQDDSLRVHFLNIDWHTYSPEQLVFSGDTLHLCTF